jgi:apolipoprotein D and lipocalin family protein
MASLCFPRLFAATLASMLLAACAQKTAIKPMEAVDLQRFMGDWYVIAHIPTFVERNAYDAVESYALSPDGEIATTFRYRNGAFDAPVRILRPTGQVEPDTGNAVWGMQFIWPFRAEYLIAYVDRDYQQTIIARDARDYVWIMARTPAVSDEDYAKLVSKVAELGYPLDRLRKVPQRPPAAPPRT